MTRGKGMNSDLESAIQNVLCVAELAAGTIEAALTGETASYAFYKLLDEIDALRSAADAAHPAALRRSRCSPPNSFRARRHARPRAHRSAGLAASRGLRRTRHRSTAAHKR